MAEPVTTTAPTPAAPEPPIRPAERSDLLAVHRIERASFPQPWPFQAFEGFLGQPGFLVADRASTVAGYVVADAVQSHGRPLGHVKDLAVDPACRRGGIGTALLRRGLAALAAQGARRAKLEVRASNAEARRLYRQFGFEPRRVLPRYYADGENALVLVADLTGQA